MDVALAIADPVRRQILELVQGAVLTAGEIADRFDISRPAVSRHLRVLRECGLLVVEVRGRERFHHLDLSALLPLEEWLAELHDRWSASLDALETEVYRTRRERRMSPSMVKDKSA